MVGSACDHHGKAHRERRACEGPGSVRESREGLERSEGKPILIGTVAFVSNPSEQLPPSRSVIPLRFFLPAAMDSDKLWYPNLAQKAVLIVHFSTIAARLQMTM